MKEGFFGKKPMNFGVDDSAVMIERIVGVGKYPVEIERDRDPNEQKSFFQKVFPFV